MWTSLYYGGWDIWSLYHKVTFDGPNRLILINPGETSIDVGVDIYSDWKEWTSLRDYIKYPPAISSIGGESLGGGQFIGSTYFLENGWRIRSWEGDHQLSINGNIYTRESGDSPIVPTIGRWNIVTSFIRSSLVTTVEIPSTSTGSSSLNTQAIADAVWKYSTTGSLTPGEMGNYITSQILTFAHYLAAK
jgi:hypothetical protein